jgi:hypothetical protein
MSEADKHMLGIEGLTRAPWDDLGETVASKSEMWFKAIKQRRFEESPVQPGPDSDVIVGFAVVVWAETVIAAYRTTGSQDHPIVVSAKALTHVSDTLPEGANLEPVLETEEAHRALKWKCVVPCRNCGLYGSLAAEMLGMNSSRIRGSSI